MSYFHKAVIQSKMPTWEEIESEIDILVEVFVAKI